MKIVVVGLGYVGLSNAVLLAQHNEVIGVDISQERVRALSERRSPIDDAKLSEYLADKDLNLSASIDLQASVAGADFVIVSTPTNYNEKTNFFDTSSVESVIAQVAESEPNTCIVVKSTIPVGFIEDVRARLGTNAVIFSPEFLREGRALYDNLYPSRIIVGEKSQRARVFANLLAEGALKPNVELLFTGAREAEAIKLFSNTYLAMRVAFFNELDSYALAQGINSRDVIDGVSLDPRIGNHYNNPSFGYGGYCLPKDTKQLLANYAEIPQNLIAAIVSSNRTRASFLAEKIMEKAPKTVGVYRLVMKQDSDNMRNSAIHSVIEVLIERGIDVIVYEPLIKLSEVFLIESNLQVFFKKSDVIITNRINSELYGQSEKLFCRDLFEVN